MFLQPLEMERKMSAWFLQYAWQLLLLHRVPLIPKIHKRCWCYLFGRKNVQEGRAFPYIATETLWAGTANTVCEGVAAAAGATSKDRCSTFSTTSYTNRIG